MKIIVTGAKGFIGSVFSLRALERGHTVLALDDESRGENDTVGALAGRGTYRAFDCANGIVDASEGNVDIVAHFAAATGSLERPLDELLHLNVEMTRHVYQDALKLGAQAFLWPTTSLATAVPDSPYVQSKEIALALLKEIDTAARISIPLRFFNVMGAYKGLTELRKNEVHILPEMVRASAQRKPFTINGDDYDTADGSPSRDFVHVLDIVEYLLDMAEDKVQHGSIRQQAHEDGAIWLGKGYATTVRQMLAMYEQWAGNAPRAEVGPRRAFDCGALHVDLFQAAQFTKHRGGLAPAWATVRDELTALRPRWGAWRQGVDTAATEEQLAMAGISS
jgi:UDP-glucose 4-epimerase